MTNVTWSVERIGDVHPEDEYRQVRLTASQVSEEFTGHHIVYRVDVGVSPHLTDTGEIEREAYTRLRTYLPDVLAAIPTD
jgi:hypothetical protein